MQKPCIRADTFITLFDSDGVKLAENEDMDYSQVASQYYYSEIMDIEAQSSGYYYVMVKWSSRQAPYNLPYILEIDAFTPVDHNVCRGAKELEPGTYDESFKRASDSIDTASCTDYYGYGQDLFYKVHVPAGKMMTECSRSFLKTVAYIRTMRRLTDGMKVMQAQNFFHFGDKRRFKSRFFKHFLSHNELRVTFTKRGI